MEMITPNGTATRIVGITLTLTMNHAWVRNSFSGKRIRRMSVTVCRAAPTDMTMTLPKVSNDLTIRSKTPLTSLISGPGARTEAESDKGHPRTRSLVTEPTHQLNDVL